jgi:hypothetical protein
MKYNSINDYIQSPDKYHKDPETFISNVEKSFRKLAEEVQKEQLTEIATSYLCSGMDRLHRLWVMKTLYNAFKDVPVTIHFFNKHESRRWRDIGRLFESPSDSAKIPVPATHIPEEVTPTQQDDNPAPAPAPTPMSTRRRTRPNATSSPASPERTPALSPQPHLSSTEDSEVSVLENSTPNPEKTIRQKKKGKKKTKKGTNF